jgi:hypothetical protein
VYTKLLTERRGEKSLRRITCRDENITADLTEAASGRGNSLLN